MAKATLNVFADVAQLVGDDRDSSHFATGCSSAAPEPVCRCLTRDVVDTTRGNKVSGKTTLHVSGGTAQLNVSAANELGEPLQLTVVCKPN